MAVNIPRIVNPALESIKALIISSNQLFQSVLNGPSNEYESKLQQMISQSSTIINTAIKETQKTTQTSQDAEVINEYQTIPIKEAMFKVMEVNKEVMVEMFEEIIKGRLLIYYLKNFPIASSYTNKRIPWNETLMLGIPNPMPKTYHNKTTDVDIQAQQDILMKNTLPYIAKSIEASRTTVLTIQHLRTIEKYN